MFTKTHFNLPYKNYGSAVLSVLGNDNDSIVMVAPGQSLSGEVFFGLGLYPDGSTIADKVVEHGYDIGFVDPINFGRSVGIVTENYTRDVMADQIILAIEKVQDSYKKIYVSGFCTTSNVPLVVGSRKKIDGVILLSPAYTNIKNQGYGIEKKVNQLINQKSTTKRAFRNVSAWYKRFSEDSDQLVPASLRINDWENVLHNKLKSCNYPDTPELHWPYSTDMALDSVIYEFVTGTKGWRAGDINYPIAVMMGEFDYECLRSNGYYEFLNLVRHKVVFNQIIPNSTHFGMWENSYDIWIKKFISGLDSLNA